jgi:ankyrin repeat protein
MGKSNKFEIFMSAVIGLALGYYSLGVFNYWHSPVHYDGILFPFLNVFINLADRQYHGLNYLVEVIFQGIHGWFRVIVLMGLIFNYILFFLALKQTARKSLSLLIAAIFLVGTVSVLFYLPFLKYRFRSPDEKLRSAIYQKNKAAVEELLNKGAKIDAPSGFFQESALHDAVRNGDPKTIQMLLDKGADVNSKDKFGFTPLDTAVGKFESNPEIVKLLLEKGAKPGLSSRASEAPLCDAIPYSSVKVMEALIQGGQDINQDGPNGDTPLCKAIRYCKKDLVSFLLEKGADPNLRGEYHRYPLLEAASEYCNGNEEVNVEMCRMLLERGADIECKDYNNDDTPLIMAARQKKPGVMKLLLKAGADPNKTNKFGETPLCEAVKADSPEEIQILLAAGADVNKPGREKKSPVELARSAEKDKALLVLEPREIQGPKLKGK